MLHNPLRLVFNGGDDITGRTLDRMFPPDLPSSRSIM